MHKYQPRIHLVPVKPHQHHRHQCSDADVQTPQPKMSAETLSDLQLTSDSVVTFVFIETAFTAVTAYQNQLVNLCDIIFIADFYFYLISNLSN